MVVSANLRRDYEMLHFLEKEHKELGRTDKEIAMRRAVKEIKDRIRNTLREQERQYAEDEPWRYGEEYGSRWKKIVYAGLPEQWYMENEDVFLTREEAIKEYKDEVWCHWYNPYGDGRDCTGVWFTWRVEVFPIPELNKTIIYHFQSCDV